MHPFPQVMAGARNPREQTWAWNTADKGANVALSNLNRTMAAASISGGTVRGTNGMAAAGKWYFEILADADPAARLHVGMADAVTLLTEFPGHLGGNIGWVAITGDLRQGDNTIRTIAPYAPGDRIGIAFDAGASIFWVAKNNAWQFGNPNTGLLGDFALGHAFFPYVGGWSGSQCTAPANTFYDPPAGFLTF